MVQSNRTHANKVYPGMNKLPINDTIRFLISKIFKKQNFRLPFSFTVDRVFIEVLTTTFVVGVALRDMMFAQ